MVTVVDAACVDAVPIGGVAVVVVVCMLTLVLV